jgi:hypothetical protein
MAKRPTAEMIAEELTVPERVLLFCIASDTDWRRAGVKAATAQQMLIRGLIQRQAADSFTLTDQGRAVLESLMMRAATRGADWRNHRRCRARALVNFVWKNDNIICELFWEIWHDGGSRSRCLGPTGVKHSRMVAWAWAMSLRPSARSERCSAGAGAVFAARTM